MSRTSIKLLVMQFVAVMLVVILASCASMPSLKKPTTATKSSAKTEKSGRAAGAILAQPKFKVEEKTISAFNAALKHMSAKNYDTAIVEMQKVAKMDERISGPWVNIGMAQKSLGDVEKARLAFDKALSINPKNPFALNQLAILKREDGNFEEAEQLYMKAISTYPDYQNAHLNLAILCDAYLRKIACARDHYQEYLNLTGGTDKQVAAWMSQLEKQGS